MDAWASLLPRQVPPLARMALAYAELLGADLRVDAAALRRRLWATLLSVVLGSLAAVSALALLVAATWDTAYRLPALGAVTAVMLAGAAVSVGVARARGPAARRAFDYVRSEWGRDRELIAGFLDAASPGPERPAGE